MSDLSSFLVAQFKCDDNAASTVVIDEKGNNGVSVRNTNLMHVVGKIGGALGFNGTSDYVDTDSNCTDKFNHDFSITCLFKNSGGNFPQHLLGMDRLDPAPPHFDTYQIQLYLEKSDTDIYSIHGYYETTVNPNVKDVHVFYDLGTDIQKWIMVSFVLTKLSDTSAKGELYINGSLVNTNIDDVTMGTFFTDKNFYIGALNYNGTGIEFFNGLIDDVRIYKKALTAAEVLQLYNEANASNGGNIYTQTFASIFGTVHSVYNSSKNSIFGD